MDEGQAAAIVERMLGEPPDVVTEFIPKVGGDDSYGFRLRMRGEPCLLKVKREPGTPIGLVFFRLIRSAGVPVPDLIAYSPNAGPERQACAIWSWVDGRPATWGPGELCPYDEAELGRILRRIHDLEFTGEYGLLCDDLSRRTFASHPDLGPTSASWLGFFHCDRAAARYRDRGYLTAAEARALAQLPERLAPLFGDASHGLLHMGDIMHHGNMLIGANSRITAVVDYVESMVGDPRWELAWIDYYFGAYPFSRVPFDMARFREGYGTDHDSDDTIGRFYLLAILLFEKLLFFRPTSPRGVWAIAKVKELLASLG